MILSALTLATKTTVVMIHGAGGGGWEYDLWRPVFEKAGYRVINRDLIPVKGGYAKTGFDDYVKQVLEWTPKHGKVVYVGASMGGILALKAYEKHPAQAVVLVDSVCPAGIGDHSKKPDNPPVVRWANGPLKDTEDAMPDSDRKTVLWAWRKWRDESGGVMNTIRAGVKAAKPTCPTFVVLGEKDTDIPHADGLQLATWANAKVKSYPDMSHVGPLLSTRARVVAQDVIKFLEANRIR